jgi:hypothetical protein
MFLPDYLSYSAVNSYEECPRAWYLRYARKAKPRQAWFFAMGSAVHKSIEAYLGDGEVPEFTSIFYPLVADQMEKDPDIGSWLHAGSSTEPIIKQAAVDLGKVCVERAVKFLEDMDVWEVEYSLKLRLPGCDVPILAYIDILGEHRKHGPLIVDWKSGKSKPKNTFQLESYSALTLVSNSWKGVRFNGYWAMLHPDASPKTDRGRLVDLSHVTPEEIGARYQRAYEGMKKKVYAGQKKFGCQFCIQQDNCKINAGLTPRSKYYDKADEEGYPF